MKRANQLYSQIKQRESRDRRDDRECAMAAAEARAAARAACNAPTQKQANAEARRFQQLEATWLRQRQLSLDPLADEFRLAVERADREPIRRKINTFAAGVNPQYGWIYAFAAASRDREIKIGHTTRALRNRLREFRADHQSDAFVLSATWVKEPARLEHILHQRFVGRQVTVIGSGESKEWFRCREDEYLESLNELLTSQDDDFCCDETHSKQVDDEGYEV